MNRIRRIALGLTEAMIALGALMLSVASIFICAFGFCGAGTMFLMIALSVLALYWISERIENRKYHRTIKRICKEL